MRTLDVSAASGLALRDDRSYVVADDENTLYVFDADRAARHIVLLPDELREKKSARKKQKADFEILVDLREHGLLAMGSGSRATRERAVWIDSQKRGQRALAEKWKGSLSQF